MKQIINVLTVIAIVVVMFSHAEAQTRVVKDSQGNYHPAKRTYTYITRDTSVGIFTDKKGENYPVYKSKNNKLYYERMSRNGNIYRCYLVSEAAKPNKVGDN